MLSTRYENLGEKKIKKCFSPISDSKIHSFIEWRIQGRREGMSKKDFWTKRLLSKRTWNRITNNSIKESNASIVNLISKQMDGCHPIVTLSFLFKDSFTYRLSPLTEKKSCFRRLFCSKNWKCNTLSFVSSVKVFDNLNLFGAC